MSFLDQSELDEFITESEELLDEAESSLLAVDNGEDFSQQYDRIFRVLHSLKGAAGMTGLDTLQNYMHKAESLFQAKKDTGLSKDDLTFFLKCVDDARLILRGDTSITFKENQTTSSAPPTEKAEKKTEEILEPKAGLVWVVDDEEDLVEVFSDRFEEAGFTCQTFTNPEDVMAKLELFEPDLIFSDFKMPQMSGIELLEKVRAKNQQIPFVICSGFLEKDLIIKALQLGLFAALDKPPSDSQLIFVASNAISQYRTTKLMSKVINFLLFQFSELEKLFIKNNHQDQLDVFRKTLKELLKERAKLKAHLENLKI